MRRKRFLVILGFALLIFGGVLIVDAIRPLAYMRLGNLFRDAVSRVGKTTPANADLVFLAIDAPSMSLSESDIKGWFEMSGDDTPELRALRLMSSRFPWSREVYALISERLVNAGARAVAFDLNFPSPTDDDPLFRAALDRYSDRVVIGSNFVGGSLTRPSETLVPQTSPVDSRIGFSNFWADDDNVVRRARYRVTFEQIRDIKIKADSERFLSLAAAVLTKAGCARAIPPDPQDHMLRFTAPPEQGFPPHSVFEIFVPRYWQQNYGSGEFFRNKIVVIGAEGNWQHDEHETPFGPMPGAEIHLNAMNAALHHAFITELSRGMLISLIALAGIVAVTLSMNRASPWVCVLVLGAINGGAGWMAVFLFNHPGLDLPLVPVLMELNATALLGLVVNFTVERVDKSRLRRTLERYVSRDLVVEMLDNPMVYQESLGGSIKPVTILFSDIRGFSAITRRSNPHEVVNQLNEYFGAMVECVFLFGGTLDKFIGDAVMAVWGNIHSKGVGKDADNALRAALAMQERLALLNEKWLARGCSPLRAGIGVHHGDVVVGNVGSPQRMEFTVIGDAVNVTWKLQELTKDLGCDFIVSDQVKAVAGGEVALRSLGFIDLPGVRNSIEVFTVSDGKSETGLGTGLSKLPMERLKVESVGVGLPTDSVA